jgi:UDP-N-acetylmuramyl pentapeptide phosphotransferase/UDP-N-acetylglucosamine-1-phosphate transferase
MHTPLVMTLFRNKRDFGIVHINSTQVVLSMAEELANWIATAMSHLKEWAGIDGLALYCVLISVLAFWCICCMQHHYCRAQALLIQAFAAVEIEQSPQVWLGMLEK